MLLLVSKAGVSLFVSKARVLLLVSKGMVGDVVQVLRGGGGGRVR